MCFSITHLTDQPLSFDIDRDGDAEQIEILQTSYRYELVSRWTKRPKQGTRTNGRPLPQVWAVASQFIVGGREGDLRKAWKKILELLGGAAFEFRPLPGTDAPAVPRPNGKNPAEDWRSYRVSLQASNPRFRDAVANGELLKTIATWRAHLDQITIQPNYLYFAALEPVDADFDLFQRQTMERIHAPQAWDRVTGSSEVTVAVIDTGVDSRHPDVFRNLKPGRGWNFLAGTPAAEDDHWHGTYCAGLVGASGGNGLGMSGVNWDVSLVPIKAFDSNGIGTAAHAASAVRHAIRSGADVILCAWGNDGDSPDLKAAIKEADEHGILVVAAAGNSGLSLEDAPHFPASFGGADVGNVISVAATDPADKLLGSSGRGDTVRLAAPGREVYSTFPTRLNEYLPYHVGNGTSAAAALVAGGCALLKAHARAQQWTPSHLQIKQAILDGVDAATDVDGKPFAGGRLNLEEALAKLDQMKPNGRKRKP